MGGVVEEYLKTGLMVGEAAKLVPITEFYDLSLFQSFLHQFYLFKSFFLNYK